MIWLKPDLGNILVLFANFLSQTNSNSWHSSISFNPKRGKWRLKSHLCPWVKSFEESSDIRTWSTVGSYKLPALRKASWDALKDSITTLMFCRNQGRFYLRRLQNNIFMIKSTDSHQSTMIIWDWNHIDMLVVRKKCGYTLPF